MLSRKSNIAIIGAGKIAHSITPALIQSGYKITAIISRNRQSAGSFAQRFSIPLYSDRYEDIPVACKFIILCVPDSRIKTAALMLSGLKRNYNETLIIHLSGAEDISLLDSLKKKKALTASFHIMQTFPSTKLVKISGCYAAIESVTDIIFKFLKNLSYNLGLIPFRIKSEHKTLYHLAGVFSSNFLSGNMFSTKLLFSASGIKEASAEKVMFPIIDTTINNIKKTGPENSLSGPVERGDVNTIKKHLAAIKKLKISGGMNIKKIFLLNYICQSIMLLETAESKHGFLNEDHLIIKELLNTELKTELFISK